MRIFLPGDVTRSIDLPASEEARSNQFNRELTPQILREADWCVFDCRRAADLEQRLPELCRQFADSDATATILPSAGDAWLATLRDLPARLVSLVPRLASAGALAISVDNLLGVLPFQDTDDPLQDALIRLVEKTSGASLELSDDPIDASGATWSFPPLSPGMTPGASPTMQRHLSQFAPEELGPVLSAEDAVALVAGLFLMHDCLERSHVLAQDVEGQGRHAAGDYWHAIMHRREPDFGNSKYWYRRVGRHPAFHELARRAAGEFAQAGDAQTAAWSDRVCGRGEWNALAWVDFCEEAAAGANNAQIDVARRIQWHEMLLLLRQTARDAYGLA